MQNPERIFFSWQTRSRGFLNDLRVLEIDPAPATAVIAGFDQTQFSDSLFAVLDIDRPDNLNTAVIKRRAEFLAGRTVARAALSLLGNDPAQIPSGPNREPIWPTGIAGSITHSSGCCAAVVSNRHDTLVGIDIEDVASAAALDSIFHVTLLLDETRLIRKQDVLPPAVLATLVFSAKETLYKALFSTVRQFFGFDHAALDGPPTEQGLRLRLTKQLTHRFREGAVFDIGYQQIAGTVITWLITSAPAD